MHDRTTWIHDRSFKVFQWIMSAAFQLIIIRHSPVDAARSAHFIGRFQITTCQPD